MHEVGLRSTPGATQLLENEIRSRPGSALLNENGFDSTKLNVPRSNLLHLKELEKLVPRSLKDLNKEHSLEEKRRDPLLDISKYCYPKKIRKSFISTASITE